jgi:hypothetical protein
MFLFNCIRTERLLADALAGDEEAKRKLRLLRLPHALCVPFRDKAICKLAALISEAKAAQGMKPQTLAKVIEAALAGRYDDRLFLQFGANERHEIASLIAEITFWMDGNKTTLSHRKLGHIIARGG